MSRDNLQQKRHNRQDIIYIISNMWNPEKFAEWLEAAYQESRFKSYSDLAKESGGLSRSTIASWAKSKPQSANNKPSRPKRENVIAVANALNKDVSEALLLAGHAPMPNTSQFNAQIDDLILGFKESVLASGIKDIENQEAQERLFEDLKNIAEAMVQTEIKRQSSRQAK